MSRVAVIGPSPRIDGWALAGALLVVAPDGETGAAAWDGLPDDVEVVVVGQAVADRLGDRLAERLAVVLP